MKKQFRIKECTYNDGTTLWYIEKRNPYSLFKKWVRLDESMNFAFGSGCPYTSFEVAKYKLDSCPGYYSEKIVYEK